jgi:hypothetical protein
VRRAADAAATMLVLATVKRVLQLIGTRLNEESLAHASMKSVPV